MPVERHIFMTTQRARVTPREREIIASLCEGNSNKNIARALRITEGTVKVHLNNIFTKLGVTSRTALVALALRTLTSDVRPQTTV